MVMQKLSWIVTGVMTFAIVMVCALRFFSGRHADIIIAAGIIQLCSSLCSFSAPTDS